MSYTQKVAFNTILQIIGKVVVTIISLITIAALTRYLGISGYGDYTTIFAYVSFWAVFADFGFFWVLVREVSKPDADQQKIFNNILTLKIISGLVIFLLCSLIGFLIPQYSWTLKLGIAIVSAGWFWMSLNSTYVGLFQSRLEMYKSVISEIVGRAIILAGVLILVKLNYGLQSILAVYILGNFANFLLSYIFGSQNIKFSPRFDFPLWKYILKESFPLAVITFIGLVHFKIDTVILSLFKGSVDVGIYGVPFKILEIIILIPAMFIGNVFPILTKYFHAHDERLSQAIQKSFDFLVILGFPIVAGLITLSQPIIKLIAGQDYITISTVTIRGIDFAAPRVLEILSISVGLTFLLTVFSNLLTVIGKQQKQVMPMFVVTVFNIIANILIIPKYSYVGSAVINVLTELAMLIWWSIITKKYLGFNISLKIIPKVLLVTLIMTTGLILLKGTNVIVVSLIGAIIYGVVGYMLKVVDKETILKLMPSSLRK